MVFCVVLESGAFDWMLPSTESNSIRAVLDFLAWTASGVSVFSGVAVWLMGLSFSVAASESAVMGLSVNSGGNSMREVWRLA